MSDEELIRLAQSGDATATETLLQRYKNAVKSVARSFFLEGGETEDLIQEGMCGLYTAVQNFRPGKMSFKNFAFLCIYRRIVSAVRSATRQKHDPLNKSVSLTDNFTEELIISDLDPEEMLIGNESRKELMDSTTKPLTLEYSTSSALVQISVYHWAKSTSCAVIASTIFFLSFAISC